MRLIDRNDTSLALALVASSLVIFQQPLRIVFEAARAVEGRYHIDLVPGLAVLVCTFGFHQYRKRQQARAAAASAAAEAALERERSAELERLVTFGRALGSALDPASTHQVFWRFLPAFAHDRALWMLTRRADGWDAPVRDARSGAEWSADALEALATEALALPRSRDEHGEGVVIGEDLCFPMLVGDNAVGVLGVRNTPEITAAERRALGAAAALLAISIRNGQLLEQVRDSSVRDALTGCFNRAYAMKSLVVELSRARRSMRPLSVILFDIDEFKAVNDRFGHLAGDATLAAVGARLSAVLRASDVKCRYGGDEFFIILPDTPAAGAEHVAGALRDELARLSVSTPAGAIGISVSLGVAGVEPGERDATAVVGRADAALYQAKRSGRNQWAVAAPARAVDQPRRTVSAEPRLVQ